MVSYHPLIQAFTLCLSTVSGSGYDNRTDLEPSNQTNGGIVGFSLKLGAVERWLVTAHDPDAITNCCFDISGKNTRKSSVSYHEWQLHGYSQCIRYL